MKHIIPFLATLLLGCMSGCGTLNIDKTNALIITPSSHTNIDAGKLSKDGTLIYSIGSAFTGGNLLPEVGSSHRCRFYREHYAEGPDWLEAEPLIAIEGFQHNGVEYTKPGQQIDRIHINGLDESLGLGASLTIPMNQGKYEAGNNLIRNVRINAYEISSNINSKETNIDIIITSTAGDVINIHFCNKAIAPDGYI